METAAGREKESIVAYWSKRSEDFSRLREEELKSNKAQRWKQEIFSCISEEDKSIRILDVGTGSGFFPILLAREGYQNVTGVDLTPAMIARARKMAEGMEFPPSFYVMDAERLNFQKETFDIVLTRNLTWTLIHPERAYEEWYRVLKKGGMLINFDGDYGEDEEPEEDIPQNHAHRRIDIGLLREHDRIKAFLPGTYMKRPGVDVEMMKSVGFARISVDFCLSDRVYREKDEFYNPVPMFAIQAIK